VKDNTNQVSYKDFVKLDWEKFTNESFGLPKIFISLIKFLTNVDLANNKQSENIINYDQKSKLTYELQESYLEFIEICNNLNIPHHKVTQFEADVATMDKHPLYKKLVDSF